MSLCLLPFLLSSLAAPAPIPAPGWTPPIAPQVAQPVRRALLVGVEAYEDRHGWPRLRGPRRDVNTMRGTLLRMGFSEENLRVLLDADATHVGIETAFDELIAQSAKDDVLLFYFAGHGSRVRDVDGDELDGFDETLVPFDATLPDGRLNDLLDDDLRAMIRRANKRTDHVVFVFDCCSSGTNVRGSQDAVSRFVAPEARGLAGVRKGKHKLSDKILNSGYLEPGGSYVALSACRATESAFEVRIPGEDGKAVYQGLFTYHLADQLLNGDALSYKSLLQDVRDEIVGRRKDQTPLAEGPLKTRALFGRGVPELSSAFEIEMARKDPVLHAGLVNGLERGSVLAVYRDRTAAADRTAPLARIRLGDVVASAAEFSWLGKAPDARGAPRLWAIPAEGTRRRLDVSVVGPKDSATAGELIRLLEETKLLRNVPKGKVAFIIKLELGAQPTWRVRDSRGIQLPITAVASKSEQVRELVRALSVLGQSHLVEMMVRREEGLKLEVETAIERIDADGKVIGPLVADDSGLPALPPGERFGCRITNKSAVPIYASLLVFSPDGEIGIARHPENEDDAIMPGKTMRSQTLKLVLNRGSEAFYRTGVERFRWVITTDFHDLDNLCQKSISAPISRGLKSARPNDARESLDQQSWLTVTADIRLIVPE